MVAGKATVRQNAVKGRVGTPKSGKAREIALSNEAVAALKAHRHLRGPLVFCTMDGHMLKYTELRHPLWRACRMAGCGWCSGTHCAMGFGRNEAEAIEIMVEAAGVEGSAMAARVRSNPVYSTGRLQTR